VTYGEQMRAILKDAGLTIDEVVKYSQLWGDGSLSESKLKAHSNNTRPLGPEDMQALNRVIANHRMVMSKAKVIVFEAISAYRASKS
jgi:hypothetical protein